MTAPAPAQGYVPKCNPLDAVVILALGPALDLLGAALVAGARG